MKYIPLNINHSAFPYGGGAKKLWRPESYDTLGILRRVIHLDALGEKVPTKISGEPTWDCG